MRNRWTIGRGSCTNLWTDGEEVDIDSVVDVPESKEPGPIYTRIGHGELVGRLFLRSYLQGNPELLLQLRAEIGLRYAMQAGSDTNAERTRQRLAVLD